jgi:hypothetical protein
MILYILRPVFIGDTLVAWFEIIAIDPEKELKAPFFMVPVLTNRQLPKNLWIIPISGIDNGH